MSTKTLSEHNNSHAQAGWGSSSSNWSFENTNGPAQIQVGEAVEDRKTLGQPAAIYPELDRYRDFQRPEYPLGRQEIDVPYRLATHDLPPPTPGSLWFSGSSQVSAVSGTPSTKYSESPGPGPYSRDTTPTSVSSQSPVFAAPNRVRAPYRTTRQQSASSTRPPVTRRRAGSFPNETDTESLDSTGLAAVRESLTSSSSSSTVKDGDRTDRKEKTKEGRLPTPSSLPPRLSSQNSRQAKNISQQVNMTSPQRSRPKEVVSSPQSPRSINASPLSRSSPPARPSHHNTSNTKSQLSTATPIIQSNLRSILRGAEEHGRGSVGGCMSPLSSTISLLQNRKSHSTSNLPCLEREGDFASTKNRAAVERPYRSATGPALSMQASQANRPTSSRTRFPFFGRRKPSSDGAVKVNGKEEKRSQTRKGPVAGTGHEGYGRVGAIRRRSGSASALPHKVTHPQSSYDSLTSSDSFLADRVNPVVISGGGVIETRNTNSDARSEPNHAATVRPSTDDSKLSLEGWSIDGITPSAPPTGTSSSPLGQAERLRQTPNSDDSDGIIMQPTLAFRRSVQRLRSVSDTPMRLPQPINTTRLTSSPSPLTSFNTSPMFDETRVELQRNTSGDSSAFHSVLKESEKKPRSFRKWNIFSRSQNQVGAKSSKTKAQVAATVKAVEKRPVAFYTILDATDQEEGRGTSHAAVQEVLREADVYSQSAKVGAAADTFCASQKKPTPQHRDWLPSQPWQSFMENNTPRTPIASSSAAESSHSVSSARPSRLARVGRIPQVVKKGQMSPSSPCFSRPFQASLQSPVKNATMIYDPQSIATGSIPPLDEGNNNLVSNMNLGYGVSPGICSDKPELLAPSPRKQSDGAIYAAASRSGAARPFASATAVIPRPDDPPVEDEIWDEYNDLLGDDSMQGSQSATTSKEVTLQPQTYQNKLAKEKSSVCVACECSATRSSSSSCRTVSSDCCACSSKDGTPLAQVNLRVGSMTVSKWLTFGHVLFSEIRHELAFGQTLAGGHSILVIDGLGNDDWSFYAAETYPSASFFNLSPRAPLAPDSRKSPTMCPESPPNHHQVQYTSHLDKFPFAPQSFDAVVYRFPTAAPASHYRNILNEARRVLRADGYIELSILDSDLNHMGNRGRRTVRRLKEKIRLQDPDISLASTADLIVRQLRNVGFANIKVARVGVPVAGSIAQPGTPRKKNKAEFGNKKDSPSLAETMSDDGPSADENITKVVTRVARWWYTRCYEKTAGLAQARSIWNDRSLLSECEQLGTSLKLTVCCARAPHRITSV
ncbi:hypothetical protein E4U41_005380 [Claviceps citrina]|nr:hypothetical protein E4U41_005380 [Claviceps citrina]